MWISAESVLRQAATSTFEQVAFVLLDPADEPTASAIDAQRQVDFAGPTNGRLVLRVGGGILPSIAENMLGDASVPSADTQLDALGELANIICGNIVPALGSDAGLYQLQLCPVGCEAGSADGAQLIAGAHFAADGGTIECVLYTTSAPA